MGGRGGVVSHPYNYCEYLGTFNSGYDGPLARVGSRKESQAQQASISQIEIEPADDKKCESSSTSPNQPLLDIHTSPLIEEQSEAFNPLARLYTHFRPQPPEGAPADQPYAKTTVCLDSGEIFAQICAQSCLVKVGPKRGLFESVIPVFESFFRVKRNWLEDAVQDGDCGKILWVGMGENVGLRLKIGDRTWRGSEIMVRDEEEMAVSYLVEYQEIVIRTAYLLEMIEKSKREQLISRNAVMISYSGF